MSSFIESFKQTLAHDSVVHCRQIENLFLAPGGSAQSPIQSREGLRSDRETSVCVSSQTDTHVGKGTSAARRPPRPPTVPSSLYSLPLQGGGEEENHFSQRAGMSVISQYNCWFLTIFLGVSSAVGNKTAEVLIMEERRNGISSPCCWVWEDAETTESELTGAGAPGTSTRMSLRF